MSLFKYKGFYGSIEASVEDKCLYGKLEFIEPLVTYEGQNMLELEQAFEQAVEDYLLDCREAGREPIKPCKGSFNVRIGPALHRQALTVAKEKNLNLNEFVKQSIERALTYPALEGISEPNVSEYK